MPTYEYICEKCGFELERFQSITARPLRKCPKCGKLALNRLVGSGAGIIFKGSGFYQTDYRTESYKKGEKSEKDKTNPSTTEKKSGAKDSKTSDKTKPDNKGKKKSA
ncbi:MAG: FmdB family zinc ribbon protein [Planctomycetota bacterium]|jgi:putative FmdB family regulatory protein